MSRPDGEHRLVPDLDEHPDALGFGIARAQLPHACFKTRGRPLSLIVTSRQCANLAQVARNVHQRVRLDHQYRDTPLSQIVQVTELVTAPPGQYQVRLELADAFKVETRGITYRWQRPDNGWIVGATHGGNQPLPRARRMGQFSKVGRSRNDATRRFPQTDRVATIVQHG